VIQARFELENYTVRVLDVVKGKFGLKNRSEALNKLISDIGSSYVEPVADENVLRELDAVYEDYKKKHPNRKMSDTELKKLLGL
jgi:hypothetical protein